MQSVVEAVKELVVPILDQHRFELFDVEYVKEGPSWYLRVYIDKPGGIDIEECAVINQELSEQLDAQDPDLIPEAYFLEVSSPGAERPIRNDQEWHAAVGQFIHISLYQAINKQKVFEGHLQALNDDDITLAYRDKTAVKQVTIDKNKIAKARLAIDFSQI